MVTDVEMIAIEALPTTVRLNIGSGVHPLLGWCNIDSDPAALADAYLTVPPIPYPDNSLDEIFAGHFLEHLTRGAAAEFLDECHRCIRPGGQLGIVVPDTREIVEAYLRPTSYRTMVQFPLGQWRRVDDLDEVCDLFIFSTAQASHHQWAYDHETLTRLVGRHGFKVAGEINRWLDPRISVGAWYQFGYDFIKV